MIPQKFCGIVKEIKEILEKSNPKETILLLFILSVNLVIMITWVAALVNWIIPTQKVSAPNSIKNNDQKTHIAEAKLCLMTKAK